MEEEEEACVGGDLRLVPDEEDEEEEEDALPLPLSLELKTMILGAISSEVEWLVVWRRCVRKAKLVKLRCELCTES